MKPLQGLHDAGMRLAQEAMSRAVSAPARPRRTISAGLRQEALTKAGFSLKDPPTPKRRPSKRRK
jgi:hypothetical protein